MTSLKQIEANRRNAVKSTGPRTEDGKERASRNAIRHGLTAESVIEPMEDPEDYASFEQAVAADYEAESAVERELVLRLASLLWRLRRATSIETGLMQLETEALQEAGESSQPESTSRQGGFKALFRRGERPTHGQGVEARSDRVSNLHALENNVTDHGPKSVSSWAVVQHDLTRQFLRLARLDNGAFERLGRYEMALWRQVRQTIFTLEGLRWRGASTRRPSQQIWRRAREAAFD